MRKIGFVLAVAFLAIALPFAAQADPATNQSVNVTGWNDLGPNPTADIHGTASLIRRDNGISMTFRTSGLPANQPVTVWWIIVDPATGNVVSAQFADGHIVGANGVASFAGSLKEGDTSGCFAPAFPCAGLTDARGARWVGAEGPPNRRSLLSFAARGVKLLRIVPKRSRS